ncbi:MAG: PadR family transcriptional regulator [Pelolinea sp.]|nr:PadR family transcriptional regulator [Pelolinea sp.]
MKDPLIHDLYIGFIRIHILYHASRDRVYGLALMTELARHGYQVGPGTLYPMLHALEEKGLLESEKKVVNGKRRRYYRITAYGAKALETARAHTAELISEINEE